MTEISLDRWIFLYEVIILVSMIVNFTIILINLVFAVTRREISEMFGFIFTFFSFLSNILISLFGILISIDSIKIHGYDDSPTKGFYEFIKDVLKIYKKSDLIYKSFSIIEKLNRIKIPGTRIEFIRDGKENKEKSYYDVLVEFKSLIKGNLLYRVSMSNYLKLITIIFFFFNTIMFFVPYYNKNEITNTTEKLVGIFMGVLNQIFSLGFSYIAIVCDNVNFLHKICDNLLNDINDPFFNEKSTKRKIENTFDIISNPLNIIFKSNSDLDKENISDNLNMSASIFGNPKN